MTKKTTLDRIFGAANSLVRLYVWVPNLTTGDGDWAAAPITAAEMANLTVHRGRTSALTVVSDPHTLTFTLAGDLAASGLDAATAVQLRINQAAIDNARPGLSFLLPRFTGRITDLGDVDVDPRSRGLTTPVTAVSLLAKLGNVRYNLGVQAAGTSDVDILNYAFTGMWIADAGVRIGAWDVSPLDWLVPLNAEAPLPIGHRFLAIDASNGDLAALVQTVATSANGVVYELPDGTIGYRRERFTTGGIDLPTSAIVAPAKAAKRIGDVINYQEVSWGASGLVRSPALDPDGTAPLDASIDAIGYYPGGTIATVLANQADAQALADFVTGRYGAPTWRLPTVTVDVLKMIQDPAVADVTVEDLLNLDVEQAVRLTGAWPADSPIAGGRTYWVGSIDEQITAESWRITLGLFDWAQLSPDQTWAQIPATLRWQDYPANIDWRRASAYRP